MATTSAGKHFAKYLEPLTTIQQEYVKARLEGMSKVAAATAAGVPSPRHNGHKVERSKAVMEALRVGREIMATEVMFTRKRAHEMLEEAYRNAATATEQVLAANALIKLHGVAAPEVKEIHQKHSGSVKHEQIAQLSNDELFKLAKLPDSELPEIIDGEYEVLDAPHEEEAEAEEDDG